MKTEAEIDHARKIIVQSLSVPGISKAQQAVLQGMSTALLWVRERHFANPNALEQLVAGKPIFTPPKYCRRCLTVPCICGPEDL